MAEPEDAGLTEEQMLLEALALSLQQSSQPSMPQRAATNQSEDSLLSTDVREELRQQSSQGTFSSVSSSPDLGISTADVSRSEINEAVSFTNKTSAELPYARLSSLHDKNNSLDKPPPDSKPSHAVTWFPSSEALAVILSVGISENAAKRGLYYTGNDNADSAIKWVFEHLSDENLHEPFEPPSMINSGQSSQFGPGPVYHSFDDLMQVAEKYKMVFVVNNSLKMGVGKLAAQVGHATLGLYHFLQGQADQLEGLKTWEQHGSKKVVLKGENSQELLELKRKAFEMNVGNIVVHDAGHTQVAPGSLTVLALFGRVEVVDLITGKLKLL